VHGCFWHRHPFCRYATTPAERREFWLDKFARNVVRDQRNLILLEQTGWTTFVIWECESRDELNLDALYWRIRAASCTGASVPQARREREQKSGPQAASSCPAMDRG